MTLGRIQTALVALALSAASLLTVAPAHAADRHIDGFVGGVAAHQLPRQIGGAFTVPRDIAVYEGTDGDPSNDKVFVADRGVNKDDLGNTGSSRVQAFDAVTGAFEQAWGKDSVSAGAPGDTGTGYEVCTVAADCKGSVAGTGAGEFGSFSGQGIAVDNQNGWVYVFDTVNFRVQKFDVNGNFILMFGRDVLSSGGTGAEVCTAALALQCKAGVAGSGPGELGVNSSSEPRLYVHPGTGDVFVADAGNRRIQQFASSGAFVRAWGYDVIPGGAAEFEVCVASCQAGQTTNGGANNGQFGAGQPQHVAVDSQGVVYASDSGNANRIVRFDSDEHATPSTALLAPVTATDATPSGNLLAGSTIGLEADPTTNRLHVLREPAGSAVHVRVQEISPDGATVFSTSPPAGDPGQLGESEPGLGLQAGTGRYFIPVFAGTFQFTACPYERELGDQSCSGYFVLDADGANPPLATLGSATNVTAFSAEFSGTVEPNGYARYYFEQSDDGGDSWTKASPSRPAASQGAVAVSDTATDLVPNSDYLFRLVVFKIHGMTVRIDVVTPAGSFSTKEIPPSVTTLPPSSFSDTSAVLAARVNPNNKQTSYRFEWGLTEAYGNSVPVPNGNAGSGYGEVGVSAVIDGLLPNTTYHYRIVADNGVEVSPSVTEVKGEDRSFTTRAPFAGFPQRPYEQVSPVEKEGADVSRRLPGTGSENSFITLWPASPSGDAKMFTSVRALEPAAWGGSKDLQTYVAKRDPERGWYTAHAAIPPLNVPNDEYANNVRHISSDLSKVFLRSELSLIGSLPEPGYVLNDLAADTLTFIAGVGGGASDTRGMSPDGDVLTFQSLGQLTTDPGLPGTDVLKAYEWTAEDGVRLIGVRPDGTPFAGETNPTSISEDGEYVTFTARFSPTLEEVYRREGGETTVHISASQRATPDPSGPQTKRFLGATEGQGPDDPAAVFFSSAEKLTDDPTNASAGDGDLYRYDANSGDLVNISAETNSADGADVQGLVGFSADAKWVYYVARGEVVSGAGVVGEPNLYMWHDDGSSNGETTFIATLASDGGCVSRQDSCSYSSALRRRARVSDDGQVAIFQSASSLTGYRNDGHTQVYVYEAGANAGAGQLSCVSCRPDGAVASFDALVADMRLLESNPLSADGKRVFFETVEPLLAADVNAYRDVYEWSEGRLRLISSGDSDDHSFFESATADGQSVFFLTRSRLVAQDRDDLTDVYVARVGGGIAAQNELPPDPRVPCGGEDCKPGAPPPPPAVDPSTSVFEGEGNPSPGVDCAAISRRARKAARLARKASRRAAALRGEGGRAADRAEQRAAANRKRAARLAKQARACRTQRSQG